jgi:N-acetylglucosamine-6-phosphate deacetylase
MNLIDLHTHGLFGRDSRSKYPTEYLKLAAMYKFHGTDCFLPTLFPGPLADMRAQLAAIKAAMDMQGAHRLETWEHGGAGSEGYTDALIVGANVEGPFLNPDKCGGLDKGGFLEPTQDNLSMLVDGFEDIIRVMTVAPELPGALKVIERLTEMGIRVNMGHSAATFEQAKAGKEAGAAGVTHLFNAMSTIHHREPGLAGYALVENELFVEVIADMAHIHPEVLRLILRCKPPERVLLVSDSLAGAKTDGVPESGPLYMPDGATLAGSGITLGDAVKNIVSLGVPPDTAILFASTNPRRFLEGGAKRV